VSSVNKFRITLWAIDATTGWRGEQKAVVFDASNIGVEELANDVGSAFWTISNDHPQITEFLPLERHYEICRWSADRTRWEFVGAGVINDYTTTDTETVFNGLDYKAILEQIYTPLSNITFASAQPLNPNINQSLLSSIFIKQDSNTVLSKDVVHGSAYTSVDNPDGETQYDVTGDVSVTAFSIQNIAETTIVIGTATATTPSVVLTFSAICKDASTGVADRWTSRPEFRFRLNASPPTVKDSGTPPMTSTGAVCEFSMGADSTSGAGKFTVTNRTLTLYPYETKQALIASGAASSAMLDAAIGSSSTTSALSAFSLRRGMTYAFQLYAATFRRGDATATGFKVKYPKWIIGNAGLIVDESTVGQGTEDVATVITRVFQNAKSAKTYSRIRYASLSISGSTYTTHTTYSAGQPSLQYIGDLCDLEMGARGGNSKAIFGIDKPSGGDSYTGNFLLRLNVSSAAITTGPSLRYPENIKSFSFVPGFSRVRNDITVVPTERYLSGTSGQGSGGVQIIGSTASDTTSISAYGRIPLVAPKGGFINATAADNEAARMLNTYKKENTKQVSLRVAIDGIDIWNGWDVGDSIGVQIVRGITSINEPFVIAGVRWFGEQDGHERIELDLVQGSAFAAAFLVSATPSLSSGGSTGGSTTTTGFRRPPRTDPRGNPIR
jgi:hypothetical protein